MGQSGCRTTAQCDWGAVCDAMHHTVAGCMVSVCATWLGVTKMKYLPYCCYQVCTKNTVLLANGEEQCTTFKLGSSYKHS
jgi:hypothetical protein